MRVLARRACSILFQLLKSQGERKTFLLPANVCPVVPLVFLKAGTPFEFVDISPVDLCLDQEAVMERIARSKDRYGGVLFVHTYGFLGEFAAFFRALKEQKDSLLVVDDRCLCPPDLEAERDACVDVALYSTGYAKYVDLGWGGYGFLREGLPYHADPIPFWEQDWLSLAAACQQAIAAGQPFAYHDSAWLDTRPPERELTAYLAEVAQEKARMVDWKQSLNRIYTEGLPKEMQLPAAFQHWRFQIRVPHKERLLHSIRAAGLFASSHYASLADVFVPGQARCAESLAQSVVNLFNDRYFDAGKASRLVEVVQRHEENYGTEVATTSLV